MEPQRNSTTPLDMYTWQFLRLFVIHTLARSWLYQASARIRSGRARGDTSDIVPLPKEIDSWQT